MSFRLVLPERPLPGVTVEVLPLVALPPDLRAWSRAQLGAEARVGGVREVTTEAGWPLSLVRSDVVAGDAVVEARVHALYRFEVYGGVAVARGAVEALADELVALFRAGRPDFADREVIALADVWEGFEEVTS